MQTVDQGWEHTTTGLALRLGEQATPVPAAVAGLLIGADGEGLSPCPAVDVLALETRLRRLVAARRAEVLAAERGVWEARHPAADLPQRVVSPAIRAAVDVRNTAARRLRESRATLDELREWVIAARPRTGWLAEAAAGWQRGPEPPATVAFHPTMDAFLAADPRRATRTEWGGRRIDGVERWGTAWRRDGDDDDPGAADLGGVDRWGPWSVGYIARTGELYAVRRAAHLPGEVWVLGSVLDTRESARSLLDPLMARMREPNSVVLVAAAVGEAMRRWAGPAPLPRAGETTPAPGSEVGTP